MYILDSSAIIEILRGTQCGKRIEEKIQDCRIAITVFSIYEVIIGEAPRNIENAFSFLRATEILSFDKESAENSLEIGIELTKKGRKTTLVDIFIAGICKKNNLPLMTLDAGFQNINGLNIILIK